MCPQKLDIEWYGEGRLLPFLMPRLIKCALHGSDLTRALSYLSILNVIPCKVYSLDICLLVACLTVGFRDSSCAVRALAMSGLCALVKSYPDKILLTTMVLPLKLAARHVRPENEPAASTAVDLWVNAVDIPGWDKPTRACFKLPNAMALISRGLDLNQSEGQLRIRTFHLMVKLSKAFPRAFVKSMLPLTNRLLESTSWKEQELGTAFVWLLVNGIVTARTAIPTL